MILENNDTARDCGNAARPFQIHLVWVFFRISILET